MPAGGRGSRLPQGRPAGARGRPGAVAGLRHRGLLQVRDARHQRRPGAHHVVLVRGRVRGRLPHVPLRPSGADHHRGHDAQPRNQGHGPATGAVLRPEQGDDEVACRHCRAYPQSVPFALHRPPLHHGPRTLRPADATLPRHCGTPRLAGHRLVPQCPSQHHQQDTPRHHV